MRTVSLRLVDLQRSVIPIGFVDENLHSQIRIDCKKLFEEYPSAIPTLAVKPSAGDAYPAIVSRDGDWVIWDVTSSDVQSVDVGELQLTFTTGQIVAKSYVGHYRVNESIMPNGSAPTPIQNWITVANNALEAFPKGGSTGQVLAKKSGTDYNTEWVNQGGGVSDYDELTSRPQIGGVTLTGNKSLHDLGIASENDIPDVPVQDVQINGASILGQNGVANVPTAGTNTLGAVMTQSGYGINVAGTGNSQGRISTDKASSSIIKAETDQYRPIVPYNQHEAVFYGLAKVAGHDEKDSENPVGTYSAEAKTAIKTMLGVAEPSSIIDDTEKGAGKTYSSNKIDSELSALLTEINSRPEVKESTESGVDFDVSDEDGNVILRLENGHIKTKKFDSENANGVKESTATGVDFDISDDDGYVVMRLQDGHIKTKNFDSSNIGDNRAAVETFTKSGSYTNGTALELTIDKTFNKGDRLLIHVEDGSAFYEAGHRATYYESGTAFLSSHKGSNAYIEHIVTANNATIKVRFGGSEYGHDVSNITVYVYRINGEIKPKIVTVASDGSGMFTTIRGAIDSITDANAHTNPYEIWVYPGTYNTLSGYSDEEIADVQVPYTETSFVGPKLTDGISIKGVGKTRDEVVLTASLDPEVWSTDVRGQVSPLNIQGSGSIENMTILGYNTRYCVHDDFRNPSNEVTFRKLKNLKFGGYLTNTSKFTTYGAGMSTPRDYIIEDCDFGFGAGIHGNTNFSKECQIILRNCNGYMFGIGDYADEETDATVNFEFDNCSFERIFVANKYPSISPHVRIYGVGNEQTMVSCDADYIYEFGNIVKIEAGFNAGEVVRHEASTDMFELTDSIDTYCGIIINADSNYSYMQKSGFISSAFLGLSNLSVGDYVTVDSVTKKVVSGGTASNAIGVVVVTESSGRAFIKMRK